MNLKKFPPIVYFMILGIIMTVGYVMKITRPVEKPEPLASPLIAAYENSVSGVGIIEAYGENINIAPYFDGKVETIYVQAGEKVKKDSPILKIDSVELENEIKVLKTEAQEIKVKLDDAKLQLSDLESISDPRAVNGQDLKRKQANVKLFTAQLNNMQAKISQLQSKINRSIIKAPVNGEILKVNIRKGEYIYATALEPAILMGKTDKLQVRVDIDEVNAAKVRPNMEGEMIIKGNNELKTPIHYLRTEPYVTPKKSLSGSNDERVDVRVLQMIYEIEPPKFPIYVGQQVNVFLKK